jgi:hypothetical protein
MREYVALEARARRGAELDPAAVRRQAEAGAYTRPHFRLT